MSLRNRVLGVVSLILILVLSTATLYASPWITDGFAVSRAVESFAKEWDGVSDGCGFNCKGCGVRTTWKVPFGRQVRIVYACGLLPYDSPEFHNEREIFVSFVGTVHGIPGP